MSTGKKFLILYLVVILFSAGAVASSQIQGSLSSKAGSINRSSHSVESSSVELSGEATKIFAEPRPASRITLADQCDGDWQGDAALFIQDFYFGFEYYATYQDPVETGCANTYPFEIRNIYWSVFNRTGEDLTIDLQPLIYTVDLSDPECPKPGVVCCQGDMFQVTIPDSITSALIIMELSDPCCVTGPYFAGVYNPTSIGIGKLEVVTDSGTSMGGLFPRRECASYNNYRGLWEDLIVDYGFPGNLKLWSDGFNSDQNDCDGCVSVIPAGVDLWVTPDDGGSTVSDFTETPLPADFFGPGSDPFDQPITLRGAPLITDPPGALGPVDAIVERLGEVQLPDVGNSGTVDIEIVALSLVSVEPITVTFGAGSGELWDVEVSLSEQVLQQTGQMNITRNCCTGGGYDSQLPVTPKFIFTRQSDDQQIVLDPPTGLPPIVFDGSGHWSTQTDPFNLITYPGLVSVDHDRNSETTGLYLGLSSSFTPGIRTVPCAPGSPNDPACAGKELTKEQALLASHNVFPPQGESPPEGACCLPDGSCLITQEDCCSDLMGGEYLGDGTTCTPDPCVTNCCVGATGNVDGDPSEIIDIGDLTALIDYLFITFAVPQCLEEANCDGSINGIVDIGDLTALIDFLFITFAPLAQCL